jgi:DNA-binding CsgD family transcriptional regulator
MSSLVSIDVGMSPRGAVVQRLIGAHLPERRVFADTALWTELVDGHLTVVNHGIDASEAWLELESRRPQTHKGFSHSQALVTERVLSGESQKAIVFERGVSASLVSSICGQVLRGFGLSCSIRRAPLALAMVAVAHQSAGSISLPNYRTLPGKQPGHLEVRMGRPEMVLHDRLTPAEYDTLRSVFAGLSYGGVGVLRGTSPRTVANQLRSVSFKLGVSGRLQLIRLALELANGVGFTAEEPSRVAAHPQKRPRHFATNDAAC